MKYRKNGLISLGILVMLFLVLGSSRVGREDARAQELSYKYRSSHAPRRTTKDENDDMR